MGSLVNLLKKLLGGIFGFLGGLFGGKKSSGGYYLELDEAQSVGSSSSEPVATLAAPAEATPVETPNGASPAEPAVAVATPIPVAVATPAAVPAAGETFADKYLVPTSTNGRRRPGANMNSYLDMARGMKTGG